MKKYISLSLVFFILLLTGNLHAKKKGAELIIHKTDRTQVRGELIAVKRSSLLLMDSEGADVTAGVEKVGVVKIVKKSKAEKGALLDFNRCRWIDSFMNFLIHELPFRVFSM
jgi:hypothetical protein